MKKMMLALAVLSAASTGVWAHSKAEQTIPANAATVEVLEFVEIRFDDPMRVTAFKVTGPNGEVPFQRETGMEAVLEFRALPPVNLSQGDYTVDWRGLSADGHPMQGSFAFTLTD